MMNRENRNGAGRGVTIMITALIWAISAILAGGALGQTGGKPTADSRTRLTVDPNTPAPAYVQGELVLKVAGEYSVGDLAASYGDSVYEYLPQLDCYLLATDADADLEELAAEIESEPGVVFCHPNYLTDAMQPVQGSLPVSDVSGTGNYISQPAAITLDLADANSVATGAGVTIALIDGGVDFDHPEFGDALISAYDYVADDSLARDEPGGPSSGHGTFVAGVLHLAAPGAEIRAYRVIDETGIGDGYVVADAILQAVEDGCHIINISLVMLEEHEAIKLALQYAADNNVLVVVAAGNGHSDLSHYPAFDPNTLAVTAVDSLNLLADFSSYGGHVDVCAPGTRIYAPYQDLGFAWWGGTSFATPFVAAQAALILSVAPWASASWIQNTIINTATNVDDINPDFAGMLGAGLIQPPASLEGLGSDDSAFVFNDTDLVLYIEEGSTDSLMGRVIVSSTNEPAPYTVSVVEPAVFTTLTTSTGTTSEWVYFTVEGSSLSTGVYWDTLLFLVEGVPYEVRHPIMLTVGQGEPPIHSAWISPDTLFMSTPEGDYFTMIIAPPVYLASSNAPALYTGTQQGIGDPVFAFLYDTVGYTNDSVFVNVDPTDLTPGDYYNTMWFDVDGVDYDVPLTIALNIFADTSGSSAWVSPPSFTYTLDVATDPIFGNCFHVYSPGPSVPYTAELVGVPSFTALVEWISGWTNDAVGLCFAVDGNHLDTGFYTDTLELTVEGADNNPIRAYINLIVQESTPDTGASCCEMVGDINGNGIVFEYNDIWEMEHLINTGDTSNVPCIGNADINGDCLVDISDLHLLEIIIGGDSIPFDECAFCTTYVFIPDTAAGEMACCEEAGDVNGNGIAYEIADATDLEYLLTTGDTSAVPCIGNADITGDCRIDADDLAYMEAVIVGDTVPIPVECGNCRSYAVIMDSVGIETAWVSPSTVLYTVNQGSTLETTGCIFLNSSNAPAAYTVTTHGVAQVAYLIDSSGMTPDSVCYNIISTPAAEPGTYIDTLLFTVEGVDNNPVKATIILTVRDTTGLPDSAWFTGEGPTDFWIEEGDTELFPGCVTVNSSNAPATFTATIQDQADFTTLYDTIGTTIQDSLQMPPFNAFCYDVSVGALDSGFYADTIAFVIDGIRSPLLLQITLNVYPPGTGGPTACCEMVGDIDGNGIAYELGDADALEYVLSTTDTSNVPCIGNADITGDCMIGVDDLTHLEEIIDGSRQPVSDCGSCTAYYLTYMDSSSEESQIVLEQNFPNPFNPSTEISCFVPSRSHTRLNIYNVMGRLVTTLVDRELEAGRHTFTWDGSKAASGIYFYRLETGDLTETKKMLLLK